MAATPYHVAESFIKGKRDKAGEFTTDGTAIRSYALLLAVRHPDGSITVEHPLDGSHNVSVTTARHIKALAATLSRTFGTGQELRENYVKFLATLQPGARL